MLSSRKTETVVLIKPDAAIIKHKDEKPKNKRDEFGKMDTLIELIMIYAFVIFIFVTGFYKMKLLSDEIESDKSNTSTLKPGWIYNHKIDLSDIQYRTYRQNFAMYLQFAIVFIIASKIWKYGIYFYHKHQLLLDDNNASTSINYHLLTILASIHNIFHLLIGLIFVLYLHGSSCIVMIFLLWINYLIAKLLYTTKYFTIMTWTYNVLMAFISFKYQQILSSNVFSKFSVGLSWIDLFFNKITNWSSSYRFAILRCISFNMDLYYLSTEQKIYNFKYDDNTELINIDDFNFINYFGYLLYIPLELMGPIISFSEWIIQIKLKFVNMGNLSIEDKNKKDLSYKNLILYFFRFCFLWVLHEVFLHFYYMHYISRFGYPSDTNKRKDYLIILALVSYVHLKLIWLKFSVIWKFSRLWALLDDIIPIENMQRCISNTTSIIEFWKYWHSSFNLWNIRYLYIPLGGNKQRRIINTLIVFMFVFLFHGDFELNLLFWSLFMFIGITPEILVKRFCLKHYKLKNNRYILALGASINVMILIIANNIGFGGGLQRMMNVLNQFFVNNLSNGIPTFLFCYFSVFMVVLVMYHIRYLQQIYFK